MTHQLCIVLDPGGPYARLLARRVRECGVFCEILPGSTPLSVITERRPCGILLAGTADSFRSIAFPEGITSLGIPLLGIGSSALWLMQALGGTIAPCHVPESGSTMTSYDTSSVLFGGIQMPEQAASWMHRQETVSELPEGFTVTARTTSGPAAMECPERRLYALQLHPEMRETFAGLGMLDSFLKNVCGCTGDWSMVDYAQTAIDTIRENAGDGNVLLALSGNAEDLTAAVLLSNALGERFTALFADHGFYRSNEAEEILSACRSIGMRVERIDAADDFLDALDGIRDPDEKRGAFCCCMERVLEREVQRRGGRFLSGEALDDLRPDTLKPLFPDEVRRLGRSLGLPASMMQRHFLPAHGLSCRVEGVVTKELLSILQQADCIFRQEIARAGLEQSVGAHYAVLTDRGTIALRCRRASELSDAGFASLPYEVLAVVSARITSEIAQIRRVVYDITLQPEE